MSLTYAEAVSRLDQHGQTHVLRFWERLEDHRRAALLRQVEFLDFDLLATMKRQILHPAGGHTHAGIEPAPVFAPSPSERAAAIREGEESLQAGKVAVILVAGGQGSRLGFDGPKGVYPVGPITGASLFEIHSRKILALEKRCGASIPFYIMTSETTHEPSAVFFEQHRCFGLDAGRVKFFMQGQWPALWPDGRLVLEKPDRIAVSPDGHGGVLAALRNAGMLDDMAGRGIETVFYFQVDNPLVEIADPLFVGLHRQHAAEMSLKVCAKRDPEEGLGVVVRRDGRFGVVEYTELTPEQRHATGPDGRLRFRYGSVAIHAFSRRFLEREAESSLPLHRAHKKVPYCDDAGREIKPDRPNAFKFEKFIFDALPDARRSLILEFAREEEFSPIKNAQGVDSPETARRDLMEKWARWLEAGGVVPPRDGRGELRHQIEIDPVFASSAGDLRARRPAGLSVNGDLLLR